MAKAELNTNVNSISRISAGTSFKGEIYSPFDLRIDGTYSGKIFSEGKVVVGDSAEIRGEVACENVDVWGRVEGDLYVKESLSLKSGCTMTGGLYVKKLFIELGAMFNGTCKMIDDAEFETATKDIKDSVSSVK